MATLKRIAQVAVHDDRVIGVWLPTKKQSAHGKVAISIGPPHRINRENLTAEQALELADALRRGAEEIMQTRTT